MHVAVEHRFCDAHVPPKERPQLHVVRRGALQRHHAVPRARLRRLPARRHRVPLHARQVKPPHVAHVHAL
eukprot:CAMPEP_0206284300 /NCGR_PEP_ID=MMETSP0047_2-20121206/40696_1 /ASSEMBLY_ACC=CAM_ASM_000192 /TAXON_ID=195065 /ORGANISM="Chroomonas mesostigmatica_cf, Strain CCMP1168" /LENGTH=69 /DNA_ID=CAMNT_0053714735 /DNA_START=256 /DNA_END=462 /DNA_ORIENTATION=-